MNTYTATVKCRITGRVLYTHAFSIQNYPSNCGWLILTATNARYEMYAKRSMSMQRNACRTMLNHLVKHYSWRNGYRRITMSGSFSTTSYKRVPGKDEGKYGKELHNGTALFMLSNNMIEFNGEPTPGKYSEGYCLQTGDLDIPEHFEPIDVESSLLYTIEITNSNNW